jgi:hypothetical protein
VKTVIKLIKEIKKGLKGIENTGYVMGSKEC